MAALSYWGSDGENQQETEERMNLDGKVALVTGAASGIGLAIARALHEAGTRIAIVDVSADRAEDAVTVVGGPERALFLQADVSSSAQVRSAFRQTVSRFGDVDILVNNAGVQHVAPIVDYPEEKWQQLLQVMLTGTFLCTQCVLPAMQQRGWGRVINVASAHGLVASPFKSAYVAAKHGIVGFTKVLALEVAEAGITANAICPGYVRTPLVEAQIEDLSRARGLPVDEIVETLLLAGSPQRRFIEPAEIGALAVFLCSDGARSITGAALSIDGGWVAR
jgi:3-hydroxybutyrate dehydrogenase